MEQKRMRLGIIGTSGRAWELIRETIADVPTIEIAVLCDLVPAKMDKTMEILREKEYPFTPWTTTNYHEMLDKNKVDAVLITTCWNEHVEIAIDCMKAGIPSGFEVGGASSIDQCWELVKTYEKTKTPCFMLENCCFGRRELMVLNMVRQGLFGDIIACKGGYLHDLRDEVSEGKQNRHYRLRNYIHRNGENYPTHELGPIAKVLNINHGNRMLSLTSTASRAAGLHEYIKTHMPENEELLHTRFAQGDIVTTVIRCAGGETITLTLDTTLPRYYSRDFTVRGTKGMYEEVTDSIFFDEEHKDLHFKWHEQWGNAKKYADPYEHPIWKQFLSDGVHGSHGGMDWLVFNAFFDSIIEKKPCPIDVYDAASWMCITALSEESIAMGGQPVAIPDFTNGAWTTSKDPVF